MKDDQQFEEKTCQSDWRKSKRENRMKMWYENKKGKWDRDKAGKEGSCARNENENGNYDDGW